MLDNKSRIKMLEIIISNANYILKKNKKLPPEIESLLDIVEQKSKEKKLLEKINKYIEENITPEEESYSEPDLDPSLDPGLDPNLESDLKADLVPDLDSNINPDLDPGLDPSLDPNLNPDLNTDLMKGGEINMSEKEDKKNVETQHFHPCESIRKHLDLFQDEHVVVEFESDDFMKRANGRLNIIGYDFLELTPFFPPGVLILVFSSGGGGFGSTITSFIGGVFRSRIIIPISKVSSVEIV